MKTVPRQISILLTSIFILLFIYTGLDKLIQLEASRNAIQHINHPQYRLLKFQLAAYLIVADCE